MVRKRKRLWRRLWLVIVFALGMWQTESFSFPGAGAFARDYLINWLMFAACAGGLGLAIFAGPRRRVLLGAALTLWLSPLWARVEVEYATGAIRGLGAAIPMLLSAPAALWGLMPIRAARGGREWQKCALAFALILRAAALLMFDGGNVLWVDEMLLVASAIALGTLIDIAYSGFTPAALAPILVSGGWLAMLLLKPDILLKPAFLWCVLLGALALSTLMLIARGGKRRMGRALALAGIAAVMAAFLITNNMTEDGVTEAKRNGAPAAPAETSVMPSRKPLVIDD